MDRYPILQFFSYRHLPVQFQQVSEPFCELAQRMARTLDRSEESDVCLRKLLEAKDCAVRALMMMTKESK